MVAFTEVGKSVSLSRTSLRGLLHSCKAVKSLLLPPGFRNAFLPEIPRYGPTEWPI